MMLRSHSKKDSEKQKRILAAVTALAPVKKKKVKVVSFDVSGFLSDAVADDRARGYSAREENGKSKSYTQQQAKIEARFRSDLKSHYGEQIKRQFCNKP